MFLNAYFAPESRSFRWVQIELKVAKELAEEYKDFILNSGHVYIKVDNDVSKTYHE